MGKKISRPIVTNDPKPEDQPRKKITPTQRYGRYRTQVSPGLPKKGRGLYLLRQLVRGETPCWASVEYLAECSNMKPSEMRRIINFAIASGWLESTIYKHPKTLKEHDALKRVKSSLKESNALWRSLIDAKTNVLVTLTDFISNEEDYKIQISFAALGKKCHANPASLPRVVKKLEEKHLLDVKREEGVPNVYSLPGVKRTKSLPKNVMGLSIQEVIEQSEFTPRTAEALANIVKQAKRLQLIDMKSDGVLTSRVIELYTAMKAEWDAANMSSDLKIHIGGPLEILRQYLAWLLEKDWQASSKVLKLDSPAFAQFRRDYRDLEGRDPINGKERLYG